MKKKPVAKPVKKSNAKPVAKAASKTPHKVEKKASVTKAAVAKVLKKALPAAKGKAPVKVAAPVVKASVKLVKKAQIVAKEKDSKKKSTPVPVKKAEAKYQGKGKEVVKEIAKPAKPVPKAPLSAPKVEAKPVLKEAPKAKTGKSESVSAKDMKELSKKALKNKKPAKKVDETEMEDDFVSDDDLVGNDDIGEYEEELKAVEAIDEEIEEVEIAFEVKEKTGDEEVVLTDAEGRRYCRVRECDQAATVDSYCRYHYLMLWKNIQVRKKILMDGKLARYVEELTARYPDKFLEVIRRDLRTEKDFLAAIQEMEIDESSLENELEDDAQSFVEEIRGIGEAPSVDDDDY